MLETVSKVPDQFCSALAGIGLKCSQPIITINIWHLIVGLLIFLSVWALMHVLFRHRHLHTYQHLEGAKGPYGASRERRTIRLHPKTMARLVGEKGFDQITKSDAASKLNPKYQNRYFVVEIREGGKRIFKRELKLLAWALRLEPREFQVDAETLSVLKEGSESKLDDDTSDSVGVDGAFDIFVRPVRWWDIRHWLNHPSREIRFALYVAIFAALLEYSGDIIDLLQRLMTPPSN